MVGLSRCNVIEIFSVLCLVAANPDEMEVLHPIDSNDAMCSSDGAISENVNFAPNMEWGSSDPHVVTIWRSWMMPEAKLHLTITSMTGFEVYKTPSGGLTLPSPAGRRLAMLDLPPGRVDKSGVPHGGVCEGASAENS